MKRHQHQDIVTIIKIVDSKRETTPTRTLLEQHWDTFRQIISCSHINNDNRSHIHNAIPPQTKPILSPNNDSTRIQYIVHNNKDTTPTTNITSPYNNTTTTIQSFIDNIKDIQHSPPSSLVPNPFNDVPPLRDVPRVQQLEDKIDIPTTKSPRTHAFPSNFTPHVEPIPEVADSSFSPSEYIEQDETNNYLPHDNDTNSIPHSHNAHDDTNIANIDVHANVTTWTQCESYMRWRKLSTLPDNIDNWTCPDNVDKNSNTCTNPDQYDLKIGQQPSSIDPTHTISLRLLLLMMLRLHASPDILFILANVVTIRSLPVLQLPKFCYTTPYLVIRHYMLEVQ